MTISPSGFARASDHSHGDWPQFRGPRAAGIADGAKLPFGWDLEKGTNILWKTAVSGLGHASPIVVGDSVFIVTAQSDDEKPRLRVGLYGDIASVPTEQSHTWRLNCLCKHTGRILWSRSLHEGVPQIKRHTKASHANSTPASDGFHVVVSLGSEGLYCYDRCGNRLWKKDLGLLDSGYYVVPAAQWGFGSSPIIYRNVVIIQCDVQKDSFIAAFDVRNGRELWRTAREDVPTWSTPTIFEGKTRTELVVNGYKHAGGYDPATGKELWKLSGGGDIPVPTPVTAHGLVFLSSAHGRKRPLCAIREGAIGDITPKDGNQPGEYFAWYQPRSGIYMQTPLVYGDYLYACGDNGLLTCYEARTGKRVYRERLGNGSTGFTASAVAGDGKIYFTSEDGHIYVVKAGATFELLATNAMDEVCMATPAISDGQLIVRTENHVYAIGAQRVQPIIGESQSLSAGYGNCKRYGRACECSKGRVWRRLFRFSGR
ncbi:MAG TPA: PQQ-binding-like beta-propeller repeat protein [Lacipirellulaceae bacterium]|nr:PQQ-binding-like beta-propeller repeat protein [Lacipirellulaceae bacterium]